MPGKFAIKLTCLILIVLVVMGTLPFPVHASPVIYTIKISQDPATDPKLFNVFTQNNDVYMKAEDLVELTRFQLNQSGSVFVFTLGKKIVNVDVDANSLSFLGQSYSIKPVIHHDGGYWLPLSEMLPWLNVSCSISDEKILTITPNPLSFWEILSEFNPSDYYFSIANEMGGTNGSTVLMVSMLLFDTMLNTRFDRLITVDAGWSLRDYDIYMDLFKDFATSEELLTVYAEKLYSYVNDYFDMNQLGKPLGEELDKLFSIATEPGSDNLYKEIEEAKSTLDTFHVKEILSSLNLYATAIAADLEYPNLIKSVYDVDKAAPFPLAQKAARDAYMLYSDQDQLIFNCGKNFIIDIGKGKIEDVLKDGLTNSYQVYLKGIKGVLDVTWPVNKSAEEVTYLPQLAVLQQDAYHAYINHLDYANMTYDALQNSRRSAIMFLKAGKRAVEVKQKLMDQFGGAKLTDYRKNEYDLMLAKLYQCAPAAMNDSIDGKKEYSLGLLKMFGQVSLTDVNILDDTDNDTTVVYTSGQDLEKFRVYFDDYIDRDEQIDLILKTELENESYIFGLSYQYPSNQSSFGTPLKRMVALKKFDQSYEYAWTYDNMLGLEPVGIPENEIPDPHHSSETGGTVHFDVQSVGNLIFLTTYEPYPSEYGPSYLFVFSSQQILAGFQSLYDSISIAPLKLIARNGRLFNNCGDWSELDISNKPIRFIKINDYSSFAQSFEPSDYIINLTDLKTKTYNVSTQEYQGENRIMLSIDQSGLLLDSSHFEFLDENYEFGTPIYGLKNPIKLPLGVKRLIFTYPSSLKKNFNFSFYVKNQMENSNLAETDDRPGFTIINIDSDKNEYQLSIYAFTAEYKLRIIR